MNRHVVLLKSSLAKGGGAEKYTLRLAKAFEEKGCQVTILTSGPSLNTDINTLHFVKKPKLSYKHTLDFDAWCKKTIERLKPDIVFGMDRNSFQTHLRASNGVHAAFLAHRKKAEGFFKALEFKINPLHRTLLKLEKLGFEQRETQKIFTNSHMVKNEILHFYQTDPAKIEVIHNGVEWDEMQKDFDGWQKRKGAFAKELQLEESSHHLLFIGHNYKRKGLEKLLLGLSLLKEKEFHLSVLGKEKILSYFIKLRDKLGLTKKVTFFGNRADVKQFYQLADTLVIPSFYDPFANVTVEALAMGLFVVSSKTNGGHEVLDSNSGAVIEDLYDPESVALALNKALNYRKTRESALLIRNTYAYLDFSKSLSKFVEATLC